VSNLSYAGETINNNNDEKKWVRLIAVASEEMKKEIGQVWG
jgi:hypothetical protein